MKLEGMVYLLESPVFNPFFEFGDRKHGKVLLLADFFFETFSQGVIHE